MHTLVVHTVSHFLYSPGISKLRASYVDSHDRDIVFCNQKHLVNQEQLIYRMINHDGKLLLDL